MKLANWRNSEGKTQPQLASELGCAVSTVARYENGTRLPGEAAMQQIFVLSRGRVTPNDFYPLDEWRDRFPALAALCDLEAA